MKRPNPIFLGVITLVALLPHAPKLLPGSDDDFGHGRTPQSVLTAPFHTQTERRPEMPTAELPTISAESAGCTDAGLDENQDQYLDSESAEKKSDSPTMDSSQNCNAVQNLSPPTIGALHLANTHL